MPRIGFVCLCSLLVVMGAASTQARQLGSYQGLTASVADNFSCGQTVKVRVDAAAGQSFDGNPAALSKLVGLVRAAMSFECPSMQKIEIFGYADNAYAGGTSAAKSTGWRLAKFDPQAKQPKAQQQKAAQANTPSSREYTERRQNTDTRTNVAPRGGFSGPAPSSQNAVAANIPSITIPGDLVASIPGAVAPDPALLRKASEYVAAHDTCGPKGHSDGKLRLRHDVVALIWAYHLELDVLLNTRDLKEDARKRNRLISLSEARRGALDAIIAHHSSAFASIDDQKKPQALWKYSRLWTFYGNCVDEHSPTHRSRLSSGRIYAQQLKTYVSRKYNGFNIDSDKFQFLYNFYLPYALNEKLSEAYSLVAPEINDAYFLPLVADIEDSTIDDRDFVQAFYQAILTPKIKLAIENRGISEEEYLRRFSLSDHWSFYSLLKPSYNLETAKSDLEELNTLVNGDHDFEAAAWRAFDRVRPLLVEKKKCVWQGDSYGNRVGSETCRIIRDPDHDSKQRASNDKVKVNMTAIKAACNKDLKAKFCSCFIENYDRNLSQDEYEIFLKDPRAYARAAATYLEEYEKGRINYGNTIAILKPLVNDPRIQYPRISFMIARKCR